MHTESGTARPFQNLRCTHRALLCAFFQAWLAGDVCLWVVASSVCVPPQRVSRRKGHKMKIRLYYESKLEKDAIVLEVSEEECEAMIEKDYRERLERACPEDRNHISRRDPQTILDDECNKPTFNSHQRETRRHVSMEALDPEGDRISDGTDLEDLFCHDDTELLREAMELLTAEQKRLLRMVYLEGIRQKEIAEMEGIDKSAVSRRMERIYARLRRSICTDW